MSEPTQPDAGAPAPEPVAPTPEPSTPSSAPSDAPITAREAAALISGTPDKQSANGQDPAADAAPPQEPRSETESGDDPSSEKPLDAPRSWTKEDKEAFALLPRETQERIQALDRQREQIFRRAQNEHAERTRHLESLAQQTEHAKQQYEAAVRQQAQILDSQYQNEFANVTFAQLREWQQTQPEKYMAWDLAHKEATAVAQQLEAQQAAQWRKTAEAQQAYVAEQSKLFAEKAPEWSDPKRFHQKQSEMIEFMAGLGFTRAELEAAATGFQPIYVQDHRVQLLIDKGMRADAAEKAVRKPALRSVPPVQRPGAAPARGEAQEARFKELNRQLDRTGDAKVAARIIAAMSRS